MLMICSGSVSAQTQTLQIPITLTPPNIQETCNQDKWKDALQITPIWETDNLPSEVETNLLLMHDFKRLYGCFSIKPTTSEKDQFWIGIDYNQNEQFSEATFDPTQGKTIGDKLIIINLNGAQAYRYTPYRYLDEHIREKDPNIIADGTAQYDQENNLLYFTYSILLSTIEPELIQQPSTINLIFGYTPSQGEESITNPYKITYATPTEYITSLKQQIANLEKELDQQKEINTDLQNALKTYKTELEQIEKTETQIESTPKPNPIWYTTPFVGAVILIAFWTWWIKRNQKTIHDFYSKQSEKLKKKYENNQDNPEYLKELSRVSENAKNDYEELEKTITPKETPPTEIPLPPDPYTALTHSIQETSQQVETISQRTEEIEIQKLEKTIIEIKKILNQLEKIDQKITEKIPINPSEVTDELAKEPPPTIEKIKEQILKTAEKQLSEKRINKRSRNTNRIGRNRKDHPT